MEAKNCWSFVDDMCFLFPKGRKSTNPNKIGGVFVDVPFFWGELRSEFRVMFSNFRRSRPAALGSFIQNQGNVPRCAQLEDGGGGWFLEQKKMKKCWKLDIVMKFQIKCGYLQLVMKFADINKCWVGSNRQWIYGKFFKWFARFIVVFGLGVIKP